MQTSFNSGWTVKRRVSAFSEMSGETAAETVVTLPHDAMLSLERTAEAAAPSGYFPGGEFEYGKTFDVPEDYRTKRVSLQFQGVYRDAMVYVNGAFAAQRPSGYATFTVPLDAYLRYGESNTVRVEAREHLDSRWYSGAGIHRDTVLIVTDLVHIETDGLRVTTPDIDTDRAVVEAVVSVRNQSIETRTVRVAASIEDTDSEIVARGESVVTVRAGGTAATRLRLYVRHPRLWSTDSPALYRATAQIVDRGETLDQQAAVFGIRSIQLDPERGLRINGREMKLRGACIHHDNGILGAATICRAEERRVEILKSAGFNAIRASHNPLSQAMLDACDRLGMIVMDETFDMWTESKTPYDYSLSFPEWWERDVEAFVAKNHNHPSVVFYSIGNEIPETGSPLGSEWGRRLAEKVRSLDPTRLVTNGINGFVSVLPQFLAMAAAHGDGASGGGVNTFMNAAGDMMNQISASELVTHATEESFSVLDVAGLNYGDGRYVMDRELFPNRVIVGTETFPTKIDANWRLVEENSHVIGDFTWTGWEYLGEAGLGRTVYTDREPLSLAAAFPMLIAGCGDIDITGFRRPASYYRETVFGLRHEPYIAVVRPQFHGEPRHEGMWTWSDAVSTWTWDVDAGSPVAVEVYSDAEQIELIVNGRSVGRQPAGRDNAFRASFETSYSPGEIVAVAFAAGVEVARTSLRTAQRDVELVIDVDRAEVDADDRDLSFVSIEIRDRFGVLATSRDHRVRVRVDGAGVLQALGSARPDPVEGYLQSSYETFEGRLQAVVRPTAPGAITVFAEAEGLDEVRVELRAEEKK
ncbi:glycoside hydrolase family 2 TIM barrel-domain containing protein [uncultured Microbacterium sp.]|uniref:Glycoside Hydrolase family protein n=1 Tax=uncultured Microbacterium sp. TaxID=191216 RepID=A0A1Y5P4H0_9MICO|nr:glycoside hydrolase family 2 TIM barrel-domain containing protein [uncultured Microbacterium sp.]SBS72189.1 Glycoside Hydrolase family protein [uncultured Microbacterium sp.]